MSVGFGPFNQQFHAALLGHSERIQQTRLVAQQTVRGVEEGGYRMRMLPLHFLFDAGQRDELAAAGRALIAIQSKLIAHFLKSIGRDRFLDLFAVPQPMRRFVNWGELLDPEYFVARFDFLETPQGYQFCEFNIDSCVAGAELYHFMDLYLAALGASLRDLQGSPLHDFAALVGQVARRKNVDRVVLLDWSVGGGSGGKGYFNFDRMRDCVAQALAPVPVYIADEKTYDPRWLAGDQARRTFVHRGFMLDEMDDGGAFLDRLLQAGTTVLSTYESEIRTNKAWFGLFHDEAIGSLLNASERALIAKYVPYTCELTDTNLESFLVRKAEYFFKAKLAFGGRGVCAGEEISVEELRALVLQSGVTNWTVQRRIPPIQVEFPVDERLQSERNNVVFGVYLYGPRTNGLLVRASTTSKVVNATTGRAQLAWGLCVSEAEKALLVDRLTNPV